ncbi:endonuclease NucS domain-containing protein [Deinococcus sp. YIM 134068]|uniref:endonuclease NucS domain-containing protein n=1 Tax=Deinococcus lichenicola TaxID=3118910 RepID=UPI002F937BF9
MNYYKVMLGKGSQFAAQAIRDGFIGIDDSTVQDLTPLLGLLEPEFRERVRPGLEAASPGASRGTISQYATTLWRIAQAIGVGDVILSPDGTPGQLRVGEVTGTYHYAAGEPLPHRRAVQWHPLPIQRSDMSVPLQNSSGGITTIIDLTAYGPEIALLTGSAAPAGLPAALPVADPSFQMEKELENFLVANWAHTELGPQYDLYADEGGNVIGQQYQTATGPIDILAVSKDRSELLVVEPKRGKATDQVVGQIQRYMGYVKREVADDGQRVRGLIIALGDDPKLQYALEVAPDISFYTYRVSFKLNHAGGHLL